MAEDYTISDQGRQALAVSNAGRKTVDIPMVVGQLRATRGSRVRATGKNAGAETRPPMLSLDQLARMETYPVIQMGLALVIAPVVAQFARATATCDDPARAAFVQRALIDSGVLYEGARTALHNQVFGVAIHETEWRSVHLTVEITEDDPASGDALPQVVWDDLALVPVALHEVNPTTVPRFKRRVQARDGKPGDGSYDGFVQRIDGEDIDIEAVASWVVPYNSRYGSLWGRSRLEGAHPYWFWAQSALIAWASWVNRKGSPTRVAYYPSGSTTINGQTIPHSEVALNTANVVDEYVAVALPSDEIAGTDTPQWRLEEIKSTDQTDIWEKYLAFIDRAILHSMLVPERVFMEARGGGTNAESETQTDTFLLTSDQILRDLARSASVYLADRTATINLDDGPPVQIEVPGLSDTERTWLRDMVTQLMTSPEVLAHIDARALLHRFGVPLGPPPAPADAGLGIAGPDAQGTAAGDVNPQDVAAAGDLPAPPPNLLLDALDVQHDLALTIALAATVDLSKYRITRDAKALSGYSVVNASTGERLSGFAAAQVLKAVQNQGKKAQAESERQAKAAARKAESAQKAAARKATSEANKAARQAASEQKKAAAAQVKSQKDAERAAAKATKDAERQAKAAANLDRQTVNNARAEKNRLERATQKMSGAAATQHLQDNGFDVEKDTSGSRADAIAQAEKVAHDNPDDIVTIVQSRDGFHVVKKPKVAFQKDRQQSTGNVALDALVDGEEPGYDAGEVDEFVAALFRKASEVIADMELVGV